MKIVANTIQQNIKIKGINIRKQKNLLVIDYIIVFLKKILRECRVSRKENAIINGICWGGWKPEKRHIIQ